MTIDGPYMIFGQLANGRDQSEPLERIQDFINEHSERYDLVKVLLYKEWETGTDRNPVYHASITCLFKIKSNIKIT